MSGRGNSRDIIYNKLFQLHYIAIFEKVIQIYETQIKITSIDKKVITVRKHLRREPTNIFVTNIDRILETLEERSVRPDGRIIPLKYLYQNIERWDPSSPPVTTLLSSVSEIPKRNIILSLIEELNIIKETVGTFKSIVALIA